MHELHPPPLPPSRVGRIKIVALPSGTMPVLRVVGEAFCRLRYLPDRRGGLPELEIHTKNLRWARAHSRALPEQRYSLLFDDGFSVPAQYVDGQGFIPLGLNRPLAEQQPPAREARPRVTSSGPARKPGRPRSGSRPPG